MSREKEERSIANPQALDRTATAMRIALVGASSIALFYALGERLLRTWDESIYAEVAKEMLERHSWLTPYWNFRPWFEKPPLLMWATAAMYRIFGVSETSARITTALCGVAVVWLTFEIGRRLMGGWGGVAAAGILLTNSYFVFLSRFGTLDVPLALCCVVAAYGYIRATTGEHGWWYAVGAATGVGLMLKGVAGILVPLSIGLALLLDWGRARFRSLQSRDGGGFSWCGRKVRNSILLALLIALPWHLMMVILYGRAFLSEYIGYHILARLGSTLEGHAGPPYFYLLQYWSEFKPFAVLALIGLGLSFGRKKNSSVVIAFFLAITLSFSAAGTKLLGYAMPAFPFVALLAALGMQGLSVLCGTARRRGYAVAIIALLSFPTYWWFQSKHLDYIYGHTGERVTERVGGIPEAALTQLSSLARPTKDDANLSPLIICLDGAEILKQQPLFYSDRPVTQAFVVSSSTTTDVNSRYFDPVPLEMAVASRPAPIIIWKVMYPQVAYSDLYDFKVLAQRGPLMLGEVSRR
jgi:4-amino-4-deoxy-L-arabinose transferase-like glycosyltransferase